jgi:integrase
MSEVHVTARAVPDKTSRPASTDRPAKPGLHPAATPGGRPAKPYPEFPLFPHAAGVWAKKIRGKLHYFGPWSDPDGALAKYLTEKDALHAGRKPRPEAGAVRVKDAVNEFLQAKKDAVANAELSQRTWDGYKAAGDFLVAELGKSRLMADLAPDDFAALRNRLARRYGPHGLGTAIQCIRCICKFAFDAGLIDRPVRYGPGFKRPSKKTLRLHRAKQGPKLFTAEEVRHLINAAGPQLRAMILLGINCGFGNADCGRLPQSAVNLDTGCIDYPRPKTGIPRRCLLWPETAEALREALAARLEPKDPSDAGLVFITSKGLCWAKDTNDCPIAKETAKLLRALKINGRKGLGFYTLRHTFRTVADEAKDQPAADYIMGHEVPHMSSVYRETISDARLRAVSDHVRKWLFAEPASDLASTACGNPSAMHESGADPVAAVQHVD